MAIKRQQQFLGQMRLDVPHLRSLESSIANDFDALAGSVMGGGQALVITGFDIVNPAAAIASLATSLQLNVANGIIFHPQASEAGTVFSVVAGTAVEVLSDNNAKVVGSFSSSSVNYIGLDLVRTADASTSDLVEFLDANTLLETPRTVPLGRILDYRIVISTVDFSTTPTVLPIAKVTTDASDMVTAIVDCRQMMYRLGSGGSVPDKAYSYSWPQSRSETVNDAALAVFQGGDKAIGNQKDFFDAMMTRLWELGGGEYWYSPTNYGDVRLACGPFDSPTIGDNFYWSGTLLSWSGLSVIFSNSTATYNTISDNLTGVALADGYCLYVDLDRSTNAPLTMSAAVPMTNVGMPTIPGSRFIVAWRHGTQVFTRAAPWEVGRTASIASDAVGANGLGQVRLSHAAGTPLYPTVIPLDANGRILNTSTGSAATSIWGTGSATGNAIGVRGSGHGTAAGIYGDGASSVSPGKGVYGVGGDRTTSSGNGGKGVEAVGGAGYGSGIGGMGVYGTGGGVSGSGNQGIGVYGDGSPGVMGQGGDNDDIGVQGYGGKDYGQGGWFEGYGASAVSNGYPCGIVAVGGGGGDGHGIGVYAQGGSAAQGVYGIGGAGAHGVEGLGGGTTGSGVKGTSGTSTSYGVWGVAATSSGATGVRGDGSLIGSGVYGVAGATCADGGVHGYGGAGAAAGPGVYGVGGATAGPGGSFQGGVGGDGIKVQGDGAGAAMRIVGAGEIILDTPRTRYKTMHCIEFVQKSGDVGLLTPGMASWAQDAAGASFQVCGILRLPAGATLISIWVQGFSSEPTLPRDIIVDVIQNRPELTGSWVSTSPPPYWATTHFTFAAGDNKWVPGPSLAPMLIGVDQVTTVLVTLPLTSSNKVCSLGGIRFEYTQPNNPGYEV